MQNLLLSHLDFTLGSSEMAFGCFAFVSCGSEFALSLLGAYSYFQSPIVLYLIAGVGMSELTAFSVGI